MLEDRIQEIVADDEVVEMEEQEILELLEMEQDSLDVCTRLFKSSSFSGKIINSERFSSLKEKGYFVADGLVEREAIESSRQYISSCNMIRAVEYRADQDPFRDRLARDDFIHWATNDNNSLLQPLKQFLSRIEADIAQFFELSGQREIQCALYKANSTGYDQHRDAFPNDDPSDTEQRRITVICYLNSEWSESDGGCLELIRNRQVLDTVEPIGARVVVFLSGVMDHRVLGCSKDRMAVTMWLT